MSETSPRMLWVFPSQHDDPWWDNFMDFVRSMDASGFAAREDRNLILAGGGELSWYPATTGLTWSEDFLIFSPSTGFFTRIVANALAPADGEIIRAEITRHPGQNVNAAAEVASIAQNTDDSLILGIRIGSNFIFRNGFYIQDGIVKDAEDLFAGGGDNFSYKTIVAGRTVTIPENQQMVLVGGITIDGALNIDGELALIPS